MGGTDWRPVNRRSGNAKTHEKRQRQAKSETDLDTSIQEAFDKWKSLKGDEEQSRG